MRYERRMRNSVSLQDILFLVALAFILVAIADSAFALDRCRQYAHDVRRFHSQYFGLDFPSEYSVAQLQAESLCRNGISSSDGIGSQGPAQITFRLWSQRLEAEGIREINTIPNHLRAQAYINRDAYNRAGCKKLWVMYQIYNGGTLVNKEIERAGICDWSRARAQCSRKVVVFGNGQRRSACDINYEYSSRIFDLGKLYREKEGNGYAFW